MHLIHYSFACKSNHKLGIPSNKSRNESLVQNLVRSSPCVLIRAVGTGSAGDAMTTPVFSEGSKRGMRLLYKLRNKNLAPPVMGTLLWPCLFVLPALLDWKWTSCSAVLLKSYVKSLLLRDEWQNNSCFGFLCLFLIFCLSSSSLCYWTWVCNLVIRKLCFTFIRLGHCSLEMD